MEFCHSVAPSSVYKAYTTHNSSICSDEGLTLETSAFQSLYGGQFTLSTPLINQIFVFYISLGFPIIFPPWYRLERTTIKRTPAFKQLL